MMPAGEDGGLRHLRGRVLQVGDLRGGLEDVGLGQPEGLLVAVVEPLGEVAGQLEVLALVLADRHEVRAVEQDVGRLEDRVGEQPDAGRALAALGGLVLELGHPAGLAEAGQALQHPAELGVAGHLALHEDRRARGVDAHREQLGGGAQGALAQHLRVLLDGDRVQVGDEEERLVVLLQVHPLPQRAEVVAEVERVGRSAGCRRAPAAGRSRTPPRTRRLGQPRVRRGGHGRILPGPARPACRARSGHPLARGARLGRVRACPDALRP